jgi:chaperonin GroES
MAKDILARGGRTAQFFPGVGVKGDADLKNLSSEPRTKAKAIKIDRTRAYKRILPKGDMLLVERRAAENLSAGGLLIPDEAKDKDRPAEGTVVAVGPMVGKSTGMLAMESASLKVGDHIIFGKYAGTEYAWGGDVLLFMREDEIIAVVED